MKSTKAQAARWLSRCIQKDQLDQKQDEPRQKDYFFVVEGFCKVAPVFFITRQEQGLCFGYHTNQVERVQKNELHWDELLQLHPFERKNLILNLFMTMIRARKKQYRTCQRCHDKFPPEAKYNLVTCLLCAP
ncbi:hypothetical protein A374_13710 [Fictibacillus macauensis ZFHKF-1]|uniref:Uncharacterized protein n=1 Tax=Fictibacillus macauensis ZFHKF-1 TaxID=1196324 RepID=I8AGE2_9BACL|nr:hypothetical protein [Fictibacillus macauensis]EIT84752.1 hypothetical protein A374_13710 [Fictibacillus macauensis ZFHKF-1]